MALESLVDTIDRALDAAGLGRAQARGQGVRATIDRALAAAGLIARSATPPRADAVHDAAPAGAPVRTRPVRREDDVIDVIDVSDVRDDVGQFLSRRHTSRHGSLGYKLYVPAAFDGRPLPLIVMLHGCKQNPDDFAAGTRMNRLAEQHGFLVAYPAQEVRANGSNCWNWFERAHQSRDGAEPALIAGIVAEIGRSHAVAPGRVYVAGLSAGAAMAVILGELYPEVFAAVAAHSGLPMGAAHDVPSAFAAMHGRTAGPVPGVAHRGARPTIVFHGDRDATVTPANGTAIVERSVAAFERAGRPLRRVDVDAGPGSRRCTTHRYVDEAGRTAVESWVVHGGAHAWFGGSPAGSYTDATGPDASAQIVRFFLG